MKQDITKIISVALSVLVALVGFISWLISIQINGKLNTTSIVSMEEKINGMAKDISGMKTDVALIKQAVGAKDMSTASSSNLFLTK